MAITHFGELGHNEDVEVTVIGSESVYVFSRDKDGYVTAAYGDSAPTNATAGYAKGCLFRDTNATGANVLLVNQGTYTSCTFAASSAATTLIGMTDFPANYTGAAQKMLQVNGTGTGNGTAVVFGARFNSMTATSGNVIVADGTAWNTSTPDAAGLVAKTGTQTVAGAKTFSDAVIFSSTVALSDDVTVTGGKKVYLRGTTEYVWSSAAGKLDLVSSDTMTLSGKDLTVTMTGNIAKTATGTYSVTSTGTSTFTGAGVTIASTGVSSGDLTITAADVMDIDGTDTLSINASAGVINIGNDDIDQAVNVASDGERTLTLGSVNGAAATNIRAGTGNITVYGVAATTVTVGKSDQTGDITVGNSSATNKTEVGCGNGNKTVNIMTGTGTNVLSIASGNATSNTIHIGDGTTGVNIITIGTDNGASSVVIKAGTGNISVTGATGTTHTYGNAAQTGTMKFAESSATIEVDIATGTGTHTVHIADGGAPNVVTLGSTNAAASLTLQSGTGDITVTGGAFNVTAGANGVNGKAVSMYSGAATTGTSGTVIIGSGAATGAAGVSGTVTIQTGAASDGASGNTGVLTLKTGASTFANSGNIDIYPGTAAGGTVGSILIGHTAPSPTINIGTNAAATIVTLGNATGATAVAVNTGTGKFVVISKGTGADAISLTASDAGGGITLEPNTGAVTFGVSNSARAWNVGTCASVQTVQMFNGAAANVVTIGSTNTTASLTLQSGTGGITVTGGKFDVNCGANVAGTGGENLTLTSGGATTGTGGSVTLESAAATGAAGISGAINIQTGAASDAASGNTGTLTLKTGASTFANSGNIDIYPGTAAGGTVGSILIGHTAPSPTINIGTNAAATTVTLGNATGATAVAVNAGTGKFVVVSKGTGIDAVSITASDAGGGLTLEPNTGGVAFGVTNTARTWNVGTCASVQTVNMFTGAAAHILTVGHTSGILALNGTMTATGNATYTGTFLAGIAASTKQYVGNPTAEGLHAKGEFRVVYDVTGGDSGTVGAHNLGATLPDKAIITCAWYKVITGFTDGDDDSATMSLGVETDDVDGILTAAAISTGTTWDATGVPIACVPDLATIGDWTVQTTAAGRNIIVTVGDATITAGKMVVWGEYVVMA